MFKKQFITWIIRPESKILIDKDNNERSW